MDMINARILARRDTTGNWNSRRDFVPLRGEIIVYTDAGQMDDGFGNMINVPGIKIGDGNAYLVDLPFVGNDARYAILQELRAHTGDWSIHVTESDRNFWNNKLNYNVDQSDAETLVLNRN